MWRNPETKENLFKIMSEESEIIVFDTETTGLKPDTCRVIQISAIKYKIDNEKKELHEIGRLDKYINPEMSIPPKITEITGITDDVVFNAPIESEAFIDFVLPFFGETPVLVAYNISFDVRFLTAMYERNGKVFEPKYQLDVLKMAKDIVDKKDTDNYKLGTIAKLYGADEGLTFHNSMDDVTATAELLSVFYYEYKDIQEAEDAENLARLGRPKKVAKVVQAHYWPGYRGMSRIYVMTDLGSFFYDIRSKSWGLKKDNLNDERDIDMVQLEKDAFKFVGVTTETEFARFRG